MSPVKTRVLILISVLIIIGIPLLVIRPQTPGPGLRAGFDAEFLTRPDGYQGLCKRYGFELPSKPLQMDSGLMYKAAADGAVDIIDGFATDGRIRAYGLMILRDDKEYFPPYYCAPLIRAETLKKHPHLESILGQLAGKISDAAMQGLNFEVDEKGRKAHDVALEFLISSKLTAEDAKPGDGSAGSVTIGGKQFTEQEILGELMAILIERNSNTAVVRKLNLGGTMICFNALKAGDLDLYAEYTGTGLVNILKEEVISDPDEAYNRVWSAFAKKYELHWLKPFGFNNTYTLTMRKDHATELGISTVSDLAEYVHRISSHRDGK